LENGGKQRSARLTSWKEIGAFLGRDERTVKRWEATRGLPIRRIPGKGRALVFAYPHELQAWLESRPADDTGDDTALDADVPVASTPSSPPAERKHPWRTLATLAALFAAVVAAGAVILLGKQFAPFGRAAPHNISQPHDPAAIAFYRSGLHEWQTRSPSGLARAITDFKAAIARDPSYAEAYAGLANSYSLSREYTSASSSGAYANAFDAAKHAVALAPNLASGHAALAFVDFYGRRDIAAASREFARAVALDPHDALARQWDATFLMSTGKFAAAREQIDRAAQLDPESASIQADKALILFFAGDVNAAIAGLKQIEEDQPTFASPHYYMYFIEFVEGRDERSLAELKTHAAEVHDPDENAVAEAGMKGLAKDGRTGMLQSLLAVEQALHSKGRPNAYAIGQLYALLGDKARAFAWLGESAARREDASVALMTDPLLGSLQGDPRFVPLLARAGFGSTLRRPHH
jgi:tetratricopeptide (TPR) repeat protein